MTFDKNARPRLRAVLKRMRKEMPDSDTVLDVGRFGYEHRPRKKKGDQVDLRDWERLNRGARPMAYLRMRKDAGLAPGTGGFPTYDLGKQPKKPRLVRATKDASWVAGVKTAMSQTRGELDAQVSAPGVSGQGGDFPRTEEQVVRRPGSQGGRGVPIWIQALRQATGVKTAGLWKLGKGTYPFRLGAVAGHLREYGSVPHGISRAMGEEGMSRAKRLKALLDQRKMRPKITGTEKTLGKSIAGSRAQTLFGRTPVSPALARGRDPMKVVGL